MKNKSLIEKCHSIEQLQYVLRKLDTMIYPVGDWNMSTYNVLRSSINDSVASRIPCLLENTSLTKEFKSSVAAHLNASLQQFLGWYDHILTLPYYVVDHVDANSTELVEYPAINSYTVRDVWDWTKFNIAQLNWIQFLIFVIKTETGEQLNFDAVYSDRNCAYAKLVSIANILGDAELIRYSTDAHLRTFCIKSDDRSVPYAVMNLFSSFENGIGGYETANRTVFETELKQLHAKFMEN